MNPKNRTLIIVVSAIALVVVLAGAAVLLTGGDDDDATSSDGQAEIEEVRPVETSGSALTPYDPTLADPTIGTPAPVIEGQAFDGTPMTIGGPTDGPSMLVFLAHWCPHCNAEIPELVALNNRGDIPDDLNVIGISTGVQPSQPNYPPSEWFVEKDWPWPVMVDDAQSTSFLFDGGSGFPYIVLLDAEGNVLSRASGHSPADEIAAWLTESLG